MGTRNLTMVVQNKEFKVAQYCQWDGYPEGKGRNILKFLSNCDINIFKEKIRSLKEWDNEEIAKLYKDFGADEDGYISFADGKRLEQKYPELSRDTGDKILELILNDQCHKVQKDIRFAGDSLFCEWAYIIDLDNLTFEVYEGFNKTPLTIEDRFHFLQTEEKQYKPVKKILSFDLNNLPTEEIFLQHFQSDEDL